MPAGVSFSHPAAPSAGGSARTSRTGSDLILLRCLNKQNRGVSDQTESRPINQYFTFRPTDEDAEGLVGLLPCDPAVQLRIIQLQTLQEGGVTFHTRPLQHVQKSSCKTNERRQEPSGRFPTGLMKTSFCSHPKCKDEEESRNLWRRSA
ncbi:hypothetical protein ILYODFUR_029824 [Ilyodon furcidens]|uniref:Uncharacterized protein n=1 Tax=Ilyodon furcidens TaxID=33524 RepID=A0ABV0VIB8_9TELE